MINDERYYGMYIFLKRTMIQSFYCKHTAAIFSGKSVRKFSLDVQKVALRKLKQLDLARTLEDLRIPPSNRLELLKGDRKGQYSIRINDQWRVCFVWTSTGAEHVEIVDYH